MPRTCRVTLSEVADMVDTIFIGNHDEHGWVAMWGNAKGAWLHQRAIPAG
jgi:hypothetical protein